MADDWDLDEAFDGGEGPSRADLERFGGELKPCPECGKEVYDQAEVCHACGHAFGHGFGGRGGGGRLATALIVALVILGLVSLFVIRLF